MTREERETIRKYTTDKKQNKKQNKGILQLQHWYVSGLCENYKLHVQNSTVDQKKKKKRKENQWMRVSTMWLHYL